MKLLRPAVKKEVDSAISRIRTSLVGIVKNCLEIGKELVFIRDTLNASKVNFINYCMANLEGFSTTSLLNYIHVYETFGGKYEIITQKVQWSSLVILTQEKYKDVLDDVLKAVKNKTGKLLNLKDLGLVKEIESKTKVNTIKKVYANAGNLNLSNVTAVVDKFGKVKIYDADKHILFAFHQEGDSLEVESSFLTEKVKTSRGMVSTGEIEELYKELDKYKRIVKGISEVAGVRGRSDGRQTKACRA